jgi:hypothetical protein
MLVRFSLSLSLSLSMKGKDWGGPGSGRIGEEVE